jgi:hypothetical protein
MSKYKISKAQTLANVQAIIAGTQENTPDASFTLRNTSYTTASLVELLDTLTSAMTAQNAIDAMAKDALLAVRAADAKVAPVLKAYRRHLLTTYGDAAQTLALYGLAPEKERTPLSVEARALKVARNQATRKARGTLGPKKRLAIRGTVEAKGAEPAVAPEKPGNT